MLFTTLATIFSLLTLAGIAALVVTKGRSKGGSAITAIGIMLLVLWTLFSSILVVDNNHIGVAKKFGETVEGSSYGPGFHFVNPVYAIVRHEALRQDFEEKGVVLAADQNPLEVNVGFATKLNPHLAWKVQSLIGQDYFTTVIKKGAQTAMRDGIAKYPWGQATTNQRDAVQKTIQTMFEKLIAEQLVAGGMSENDAHNAFIVFPVQLRKSLPDEKVRNSVAENVAAEEDLKRQQTLTKIAKEEAERRANEGLGITKLFEALPKGSDAEEISRVLSALAAKTRAEAMLKAVESGQVDTVIMNGDSSAESAVPLTGRAKPAAPSTQTTAK